jgi:hypothetical protein
VPKPARALARGGTGPWSQADDHEDGKDGTDDFTLNKSHPLFLIIYRSFGQNHRFPNKL